MLPETEATRKGPPTVQADRLVADLKTGSAKLKSAASSRLGPPPSEHDDRGGNVFNRLGVHQNVEEEEDELDNREDEVHYMVRTFWIGDPVAQRCHVLFLHIGNSSSPHDWCQAQPQDDPDEAGQWRKLCYQVSIRKAGWEGDQACSGTGNALIILPMIMLNLPLHLQRSEQGDAAAGVDASRLKRFSGTYEGNPAVRPPGRPSSENEDLEKRRVNIKRISFDEDRCTKPCSHLTVTTLHT